MILSPDDLFFFMTPHASLYHQLATTRTTQTLRIRRMCTFINYLLTSTSLRHLSPCYFFSFAFTPFHLLTYVHALETESVLTHIGLFGARGFFFAALTPSRICRVLLATLRWKFQFFDDSAL